MTLGDKTAVHTGKKERMRCNGKGKGKGIRALPLVVEFYVPFHCYRKVFLKRTEI